MKLTKEELIKKGFIPKEAEKICLCDSFFTYYLNGEKYIKNYDILFKKTPEEEEEEKLTLRFNELKKIIPNAGVMDTCMFDMEIFCMNSIKGLNDRQLHYLKNNRHMEDYK